MTAGMATGGSAMERVAKAIGDAHCITILAGAGVSCRSGIPDFRSPGGMYDTLKPSLLTATAKQRRWMKQDPTMVVNWELFEQNQLPYLELRRPFMIDVLEKKYKPPLPHWFAKILDDKKKLQRVFSQNIDGLYAQVLSSDKLVNVHGSLGQVNCEYCGAEQPLQEFVQKMRDMIKDIYKGKSGHPGPVKSTPIECVKCSQYGPKPSTVLYGRDLPEEFYELKERDLPVTDLTLVLGTSLTVGPANTIATEATSLRVLINNDSVDLGPINEGGGEDIELLGDCDEMCCALAGKLGWLDDLTEHVEEMAAESRTILETANSARKK